MSHVGISDWETKVIGFGYDGTNANIAAGGLIGLELLCFGAHPIA